MYCERVCHYWLFLLNYRLSAQLARTFSAFWTQACEDDDFVTLSDAVAQVVAAVLAA